METNIISELTTFIEHAPTAFHAVAELKEILKQEGFEELKESEKWKIKPGKRYYVTRNNSSIIAVKAGKELDNYSFHVTASHSDSPAFKLKENDLENEMQLLYNNYTALTTQVQQAQAKLLMQTPAFTTLQNASVPLKPTGPKRMIFALTCTLLTFVIMTLYFIRNVIFTKE